jgi:hypothetical protein
VCDFDFQVSVCLCFLFSGTRDCVSVLLINRRLHMYVFICVCAFLSPGDCLCLFFISQESVCLCFLFPGSRVCVSVFLINRRLYMCVFLCVCAFYDIQSALFISRCLFVFPGSRTTV